MTRQFPQLFHIPSILYINHPCSLCSGLLHACTKFLHFRNQTFTLLAKLRVNGLTTHWTRYATLSNRNSNCSKIMCNSLFFIGSHKMLRRVVITGMTPNKKNFTKVCNSINIQSLHAWWSEGPQAMRLRIN